MIYYTEWGRTVANKCESFSGVMYDSVRDYFISDIDDIYQGTTGDFNNIKSQMALKKTLAKAPEKRKVVDQHRIANIYRYYKN